MKKQFYSLRDIREDLTLKVAEMEITSLPWYTDIDLLESSDSHTSQAKKYLKYLLQFSLSSGKQTIRALHSFAFSVMRESFRQTALTFVQDMFNPTYPTLLRFMYRTSNKRYFTSSFGKEHILYMYASQVTALSDMDILKAYRSEIFLARNYNDSILCDLDTYFNPLGSDTPRISYADMKRFIENTQADTKGENN